MRYLRSYDLTDTSFPFAFTPSRPRPEMTHQSPFVVLLHLLCAAGNWLLYMAEYRTPLGIGRGAERSLRNAAMHGTGL